MSRSYKHHPFMTVCGKSNKKDKQSANRKFRRFNNIVVKHNIDKLLYKLKECSDTWSFTTDGLAYYQNIRKWKNLKFWKYLSDSELKKVFRKIFNK